MLSAFAALTTAFSPALQSRCFSPTQTAAPVMSAKADLEALAKEANPVIGFYDPLGLADLPLWKQEQDAVIGWLRHAEIKHGRVAMAGFVGYIVHTNGIRFPFLGPQTVVPEGLSAPEVWDAIPFLAKLQIIGFIGVLEHVSEDKNFLAADGAKHYMRGGKPGYMPSFSANVHPVPLKLWDPFGFTKKLTEEQKSKKLVAEINNGRLAMIGLFGFLAESKVPGSVPALTGLIKPYDGDYMAPFLPTGPDTSIWTIGNIWS
mmetsp:Transcript_34418/g.57001  ORF Transcript_34418/g.57001 Transcript_34418/m.57001 type:complete len:260 (-) Transcript_34418:365-1144(-)|eukprot:CAMPEP_0119310260 /NCGR_PEP_ID=MMETSP1333-20130426/18465_1 /TAXON_ID=418940 /ORGANISM="Scyphosphaera apsteinii, Strain RCC1455" /LENGTH=259 /DNA_ID=CAMNT_0007314413 /DNA_START=32 /DNA_END=811 /DNA_ORIENTATION=+